jgi:hemolysin-activating ACP:hemolysin acyltransferase
MTNTGAEGTSKFSGDASAIADLPADELRRRAELSKRLMSAFGEVVSVFMRSEGHRHQFLADLEWLVLPAIAAGQFSLMDAQSKSLGFTQLVGLALWARVSPEVDQRLSSNLNQSIRLKPEEWTSGDITWIVEAVGAPQAMGPLLKSLAERELKGKTIVWH